MGAKQQRQHVLSWKVGLSWKLGRCHPVHAGNELLRLLLKDEAMATRGAQTMLPLNHGGGLHLAKQSAMWKVDVPGKGCMLAGHVRSSQREWCLWCGACRENFTLGQGLIGMAVRCKLLKHHVCLQTVCCTAFLLARTTTAPPFFALFTTHLRTCLIWKALIPCPEFCFKPLSPSSS